MIAAVVRAAGGLALLLAGAGALAAEAEPAVPAASGPLAQQPPLAEHPEVAPRLALFELWIEDQRRTLGQPGVAVGIVHGDELVWARGFGYADLAARRPVTPQTVFRIGSISKTFTATAAVLLAEAGRLRLDDPVAEVLPWFRPGAAEGSPGAASTGAGEPGASPSAGGGRGRAGPVTVRHLLTHTSGLPREAPFPYWTDREFPTRELLVEAVDGVELLFEPGTAYQYSNLGLALAGEVVAAAAGESYEAFVRREILSPLGMASTFVATPAVEPERLATGYLLPPLDRERAGEAPPVAPETEARSLTPSANLSSTVADLARFVSSQFPGTATGRGRLLPAAALREMHRVHWLDPGWESGRGLGFSAWRHGGRTLVGHGGWVAGHRGQIAFEPATRLGVVVLTNSDRGGPGSYVRQAFDLVVPAIEKVVAPPPEAPPLPAGAGRYAGTYHTPWGEVSEVLVLDGELVIYDRGQPPAEDVEGSLTRLVPEGGHAFRKAREGVPGEPVVFEVGPDGRVERVKVGENYLYPEGCGRIVELRCTWE